MRGPFQGLERRQVGARGRRRRRRGRGRHRRSGFHFASLSVPSLIGSILVGGSEVCVDRFVALGNRSRVLINLSFGLLIQTSPP